MDTVNHQSHRERYIIVAIVIVALAFIIWHGPWLQYSGMKLYFPGKDGRTLHLENRPIAPIGDREAKATDVVSELLLGPISRNLQPIVHSDVSLERVVTGANGLFLDFLASDVADLSAGYTIFKASIEKSLRATIPGNYRISLYINGILAR